jgi:uncharacterized protein (TIGR00661 family)
VTLPAYKIAYKKGFFGLKMALLKSSFTNYLIYKKEQAIITQLIKEKNIKGIISDNRFGAFSKLVPSVYITHQVRVFSGWSTFLTSKIHQAIINNYAACWVPDFQSKNNLSGALSHNIALKTAIHYIKPLSQFKTLCKTSNFDYKYIIILSGIEPERSILEDKLISLFEKQTFKTQLIQGKIEVEQVINQKGNLSIVNYLIQADLEKAICKSEIVICRSGYTSIMDLQKLQKKAFFIPTPEQTEQEYLAKYLEKQQIAPFTKQADFSLADLEKIQNYRGFTNDYYMRNWVELFKIFD